MPQHLSPLSALRLSVVSGVLPHLSILNLAVTLQDAGITSVELTAGTSGHLRQWDYVAVRAARTCLADFGIEVCSVAATADWRLGDPQLVRVFEAADQLDASFVRVFAPEFDAALPHETQFRTAARALAALADNTSTEAAVVIEPSPGSLAPSPDLAKRLAEMAGGTVGVVYDPGSLLAEGHLHPALAISVLGSRLRHVHVKNRAIERRDGVLHSTSRPLQDGWVDWILVLQLLVRSGYSGGLSIDHLSARASVEQLRQDMGDLREVYRSINSELF